MCGRLLLDYCVEEWPKRWSSKAKTEKKKKKLTINVAKCFKLMTLAFGDVALSTVVPTTTSNQPSINRFQLDCRVAAHQPHKH